MSLDQANLMLTTWRTIPTSYTEWKVEYHQYRFHGQTSEVVRVWYSHDSSKLCFQESTLHPDLHYCYYGGYSEAVLASCRSSIVSLIV